MNKIEIKDLIVKTLKEYEFGVLDYKDDYIRGVKSEDFINIAETLVENLSLFDVGSAFYCQADIEGRPICEKQCDHCQEYYKPLEQ